MKTAIQYPPFWVTVIVVAAVIMAAITNQWQVAQVIALFGAAFVTVYVFCQAIISN